MNIKEGLNTLLKQFSEEFPGAPLVQIVEQPNKQERVSAMSKKTIGEVLIESIIREYERQGSGFTPIPWTLLDKEQRKTWETGANAAAIHVLEVASPTSPILAAMKAGMTWEEAVDFTAIQRMGAEQAETMNVCTAGGLHGSESVSICRCGYKVS